MFTVWLKVITPRNVLIVCVLCATFFLGCAADVLGRARAYRRGLRDGANRKPLWREETPTPAVAAKDLCDGKTREEMQRAKAADTETETTETWSPLPPTCN